MVYEDFKVLPWRTTANNVLRDKVINIAKNTKYDRYQRELTSNVYSLFNRISSGSGVKNETMSNHYFAEELHKLINKKIKTESILIY